MHAFSRKIVSMFLVFCLALSLLPTCALASEAEDDADASPADDGIVLADTGCPTKVGRVTYTVSAETVTGTEQPNAITVTTANVFFIGNISDSSTLVYLEVSGLNTDGEWTVTTTASTTSDYGYAVSSVLSAGVMQYSVFYSYASAGSRTFDVSISNGTATYKTTVTTYLANPADLLPTVEELNQEPQLISTAQDKFTASIYLTQSDVTTSLKYYSSNTIQLVNGDGDVYAQTEYQAVSIAGGHTINDPRYNDFFQSQPTLNLMCYLAQETLTVSRTLSAGSYSLVIYNAYENITNQLTISDAVQVTALPKVRLTYASREVFTNVPDSTTAVADLIVYNGDPKDFTVKLFAADGSCLGTSGDIRVIEVQEAYIEALYYITLNAPLEKDSNYTFQLLSKDSGSGNDNFVGDSTSEFTCGSDGRRILETAFASHYYANVLLRTTGYNANETYQAQLKQGDEIKARTTVSPTADGIFDIEFTDEDGTPLRLPTGAYTVQLQDYYSGAWHEAGDTSVYNNGFSIAKSVTAPADSGAVTVKLYAFQNTSAKPDYTFSLSSGNSYALSELSDGQQYESVVYDAAGTPISHSDYRYWGSETSSTCTITVTTLGGGTLSLYSPGGTVYTPDSSGVVSVPCCTEVYVLASPAEDYRLGVIQVNGNPITGRAFLVTANCGITASFTAATPKYRITAGAADTTDITGIAHCTVDLDSEYAEQGETVTFLLTAARGYVYVPDSLTVTTSNGTALDLTPGTDADSWSFVMPGNDVTINAQFAPTITATINLQNHLNSTAELPAYALPGEKVVITVDPKIQYQITTMMYSYYNDSYTYCVDYLILGKDPNTFVIDSMPDRPIELLCEATKSNQQYVSTPVDLEHGTITLTSEANQFYAGETVTFSVTPEAGYRLKDGSLYGTYESTAETVRVEPTQNDDGTWSFTMPGAAVTLHAAFEGDVTQSDANTQALWNALGGSNYATVVNSTITLTRDVTLSEMAVVSGGEITLVLGNHTITGPAAPQEDTAAVIKVTGDATLTITSSGYGSGILPGGAQAGYHGIWVDGGRLNVIGGVTVYSGKVREKELSAGIYVSSGTLFLGSDAGETQPVVHGQSYGDAIKIVGGDAVILGGRCETEYNNVISSSDVSLQGGYVPTAEEVAQMGGGDAVHLAGENATLSIEDGRFYGSGYNTSALLIEAGTAKVNGGTFYATYGVSLTVNGGHLTLYEGQFNSGWYHSIVLASTVLKDHLAAGRVAVYTVGGAQLAEEQLAQSKYNLAITIGVGHTVTVGDVSGGVVTASVSAALPGQTVRIYASPSPGCQLSALYYQEDGGNTVIDYCESERAYVIWNMPNANITICAEFVNKKTTTSVQKETLKMTTTDGGKQEVSLLFSVQELTQVATAAAAFYDSDGRMVGIGTVTLHGTTATGEITQSLTTQITGTPTHARIFLMDAYIGAPIASGNWISVSGVS